MKKLQTIIGLVATLLAGATAFAADVPEGHQRLMDQFDNIQPQDIKPSDVTGMLEVNFDGTLLYATEDGRYLVQGEVYDVARKVNVTEEKRAIRRAAALSDIDESTMILFDVENGQPERTIMVFTDIDCGYCRKLHREIADYNEQGIRVEYMFFPRSGPDTDSWAKAESVWCSDDRADALTRAKSGEVLPKATCGETPVKAHYDLGQTLGVTGTPAIMTPSGVMIAGYLPAGELRARLDMIAAQEAAVQ